jgi:hypothetical protein
VSRSKTATPANPDEAEMDLPDHRPSDEDQAILHNLIERAHWQTAKSVEHIAAGRHAYVVIGWDKDDLTEDEFWWFATTIKTYGREEEWEAASGFYDSGKRPKMRNRYLYVESDEGVFAYWFTWPQGRVPMLNREHISVQQETPTRRVLRASPSAETRCVVDPGAHLVRKAERAERRAAKRAAQLRLPGVEDPAGT